MTMGSLSEIDDLFAARFEAGLAPGLVYGVVRHGELVHSGGFGVTSVRSPGARPDQHTVMRIASMTKSFTAAALLLLRDRGLVELDEAVAHYVPEVVDQAPHSASSPAVTLRLLLTMAAGLPSDNPWGDRQESLTDEQFGTFLDGGFTPAGEVGVRYEYANLGYALLGRVIDNVVDPAAPEGAGRRFVEHELLDPLGLTSTHYDVALAAGRAWRPATSGAGTTGSRSRRWARGRSRPWAACIRRSSTSPAGSQGSRRPTTSAPTAIR